MLRVVLDTCVVVAGLRSRSGASNIVLGMAARKELLLLATTALFFEYEAVLKRPEHRNAHGLDIRAVDQFLGALASAFEPVEIGFMWRPQLSDTDDEFVLEAAINGRADVLVTHNIRDFLPAAGRFGIRVLRPGELLKELRQ